jgi:hypothetical protein
MSSSKTDDSIDEFDDSDDDSIDEFDDSDDDMYDDGISDPDDINHLTSLFDSLLSAGKPDISAIPSIEDY